MTLDVRTEIDGDLTLIFLSGELDIYSTGSFRSALDELATEGSTVVVDLSRVTLVDSSGLGVLVSLLNRARDAGGRMGLVCPSGRLRRVFDIAGLRREFTFADDLPTLRASLSAPPDQE